MLYAGELALTEKNWEAYNGYMIKKVSFKGLVKTKAYVVSREMQMAEGKKFSANIFSYDIRQLEKLDIFAQIKPVITDLDNRQKHMSIELEFVEIPYLVIHPTGEYTEENFFSLGLGGISTNLWGRNHFFEGSYKSSFTKNGVKRASVEYKIPRISNAKVESFIWLADERRLNKLLDSYETYQVARLQLFWDFFENPNYKWTHSFEGAFEVFAYDSSGITNHSSNSDLNNSLNYSLAFDSRNYGGNPNKGWYLETSFGQVGGLLAGDVDFWQSSLDIRRYQPISHRQHLLFSNLWSWQDNWGTTAFPRYKNYWIGGANTVRGYDHGVEYGKNEWLLSLEYRFLWVEPRVFSLGVFGWKADLGLQPLVAFDFGKTWNSDFSKGKWLNGQVLGLHILIPFKQMIRLEMGFSEIWEAKASMHFHLAAEPKPVVQRYRRR